MPDGKIIFSTALDNAGVQKDLKRAEREIRKYEESISNAMDAKLPLVKRLEELDSKIAKSQETLKLFKSDLNAAQGALLSGREEDRIAASGQIPNLLKVIDGQEKEVSSLKRKWASVNDEIKKYDPVTSFSVAYSGINGTGAVSTVCGVDPDADGNVALTAKDVSAVPTAGGTMTGNLSVPAPVKALHAVNKGYVDTTDSTATLTVSGWTGSGPFTQAIAVQGLTDGRRVNAHPKYGSNADDNIAMREACGCISYAERSGNSVVFTCLEDKPEVDITVTFEIYV